MILLGTAIPFVNMPSNTDGMSRNEGVNRGQASGVLQTFRMVGSTLGIALTTSVIGIVSRRSPSDGAEVCPDIDPELLGRASRGNLKELAELVATAPEACVEFVREEIARGIGWGFIIAGLVASLATIAALWWTPSPLGSESRSRKI